MAGSGVALPGHSALALPSLLKVADYGCQAQYVVMQICRNGPMARAERDADNVELDRVDLPKQLLSCLLLCTVP